VKAIEQRDSRIDELLVAKEVLHVGNDEILPILEIDDQKISHGVAGAVARRLGAIFVEAQKKFQTDSDFYERFVASESA